MNKYQKRRNKVASYKYLNKKQMNSIIYNDAEYNKFLEQVKEDNRIGMEILKKIMPQWFTDNSKKEGGADESKS